MSTYNFDMSTHQLCRVSGVSPKVHLGNIYLISNNFGRKELSTGQENPVHVCRLLPIRKPAVLLHRGALFRRNTRHQLRWKLCHPRVQGNRRWNCSQEETRKLRNAMEKNVSFEVMENGEHVTSNGKRCLQSSFAGFFPSSQSPSHTSLPDSDFYFT